MVVSNAHLIYDPYILSSHPNVSTCETSVYSIPLSPLSSIQSTFSLSSSSNIHKYKSTPALKYALKSKKSSLYKNSNNNSSSVISLVSSSSSSSSLSSSYLSSTLFDNISFSISEYSYSSSIPSLDSTSIISSYQLSSDDRHPLSKLHDQQISSSLSPPLASSNLKPSKSSVFLNKIKSKAHDLYDSYNHSLYIQNLVPNNKTKVLLSSHPSSDSTIILNGPIPLETFNSNNVATDDSIPVVYHKLIKSRESRINPNFLKLYAINTSINNSFEFDDVEYSDSLIDYHINELLNLNLQLDDYLNLIHANDSLKFLIISKFKIHSKVILNPRFDNFTSCKSSHYLNKNRNQFIKLNDSNHHSQSINGSLTRSLNKTVPWNHNLISDKKSFNPSGYLNKNTQYTVKNWCNKKWCDTSNDYDDKENKN